MGRSTVSTNLAGELSKQGKAVLIDCGIPPKVGLWSEAVLVKLDKYCDSVIS